MSPGRALARNARGDFSLPVTPSIGQTLKLSLVMVTSPYE